MDEQLDRIESNAVKGRTKNNEQLDRIEQKIDDGQLDRIEKTLERVTTVLLGVPDTGDKGLVGKVNETCEVTKILAEKHDKLNTKFWILVGVLVGSGVLGTSIWAALV